MNTATDAVGTVPHVGRERRSRVGRGNPSDRQRRADIRAFLDVSSGHLSPETWAFLDAQTTDEGVRDPDNRLGTELLGGRTRYGWFLYAHEHPAEPVPADLVAVMRLARSLGCEYVLFDSDAPPTPDLALRHPDFQDERAREALAEAGVS